MKIRSFLTMVAVAAAVATACLTMASCTVEDNAADEVDVDKEEIFFDMPTPMAAPGSYIVEAKLLGSGTKGDMKQLYTQYTEAGWRVIEQDLNQGAGGKYVYLAVRMGSLLDKDQGNYITDFYLSNQYVSSLKFEGRTYFRVGKDGDGDFDGNLNSKTKKGDKIYLYYTKNLMLDPMAVTDVYFDDQKTGNGVVGKEGKSTGSNNNPGFCGYNLNEKAGGKKIYMHQNTEVRTCWKLDAVATDNSMCLLNGFQGPTEGITAVAIPTTFNGVPVTSCSNVNALEDLVELNYYDLQNLGKFPFLSGCTKLKTLNWLDEEGDVLAENTVPEYITTIGDRTFQNTAIESLTMPGVTVVGADAFRGCNNLKQVLLDGPVKVGSGAFSFIKSEKCKVYYPGTAASWDMSTLLCSPNVTVVGITDNGNNMLAFWGWCGGKSEEEKNGLSWQLDIKGSKPYEGEYDLYIACAIDDYQKNYPDSQRIRNHGWEAYGKDIMIENLYLKDAVSVGKDEFKNTPVSHVHLYPSLKEIGNRAFNNKNLESITYHGTQQQWDAVKKDSLWLPDGVKVEIVREIQP